MVSSEVCGKFGSSGCMINDVGVIWFSNRKSKQRSIIAASSLKHISIQGWMIDSSRSFRHCRWYNGIMGEYKTIHDNMISILNMINSSLRSSMRRWKVCIYKFKRITIFLQIQYVNYGHMRMDISPTIAMSRSSRWKAMDRSCKG